MGARALSGKVARMQTLLAIGGGKGRRGDSGVRYLQPPFEYAAGDVVAMAVFAQQVRASRERRRQQARDNAEIKGAVVPILKKIDLLTEKRDTATTRADAMYFHQQIESLTAAARET